MKVFYLTLFSTYILAFISRIHFKWEKNKKPMILMTLAVMIILVSVSGLRNGIGDTRDYMHLYDLVVRNEGNYKDAYEPGFLFLLKLLTNISSDPQIMLLVTAMVTNVLNIWVLRKYSSLFELEVFMYITSGYFLVTMNGIRQALAAAILFISTKFIIDGRFKPFLIISLVASTFHTSALIMIPVYFIVRQEAWSKRIIYIILISSIMLVFMQPIMESIFAAAEGTKLGGYEEAVLGGGEGGASIIRTFIAAIPEVVSYIYREKLKNTWPDSNIFINMSLINLILMSFALYNWLFARFNFYFQTYTFILLPYLIGNVFKRKERDLIYYLFVVCYFGFFYYEHVISLGMRYTSNYISF